jgi:hypothetical protein
LIEAWSLSNDLTESETGLDHQKLDTCTDHGEFPLYDPKSRPKVRPRLYLTQTRTAALVEILVASAAVILYLGIPISKSIQKRGDVAIKKSPAVDINRAAPGSSRTETGLRLQNDSSIDPNGGLSAISFAGAAEICTDHFLPKLKLSVDGAVWVVFA